MVQSVSIKIFSSIGLWGETFNFLTPLIRNSKPLESWNSLCSKNMHYVYKYALQEDSLPKCFKSYFEEKNLLLYTSFGRTLGSLAQWPTSLINRPESKSTARIHHDFYSLVRQKWFCVVRCIVLTAF